MLAPDGTLLYWVEKVALLEENTRTHLGGSAIVRISKNLSMTKSMRAASLVTVFVNRKAVATFQDRMDLSVSC